MPEIDHEIRPASANNSRSVLTIIFLVVALSLVMFFGANSLNKELSISEGDEYVIEIARLNERVGELHKSLKLSQKEIAAQKSDNKIFRLEISELKSAIEEISKKKMEGPPDNAEVCDTFGTLTVRSNLLHDVVEIDDKAVGSTGRAVHKVCVGEHAITVSSPGHTTRLKRVNIRKDEHQTVHFKF